jgi:hypothetical protein
MKLRPGWISAIAAGVLALSALTGATGAAPASAASWTHLCTPDPPACAISEGSNNFIGMEAETSDQPVSITNWTYPATNGAVGTIQQANTDLCMQVDASAGDEIRGAACVSDQAEEWINVSTGGRTAFESVWALDNGQGNLCLGGGFEIQVSLYSCPPPLAQNNVAYMYWGTS